MNFDEETIKKLIIETLDDSLEESEELEEDVASAAKTEIATATRDAQAGAATDIELSKKLDQVIQLLQKLGAPAAPAPEAANPAEPSLKESFQITKGRLRQIIAEEMKKAKNQGLI